MSIKRLPAQKISITQGNSMISEEAIAMEEPLGISLQHGPSTNRQTSAISVTMRTPGHDEDLAIGFLFTEGIIPNGKAIRQVTRESPDRLTVSLHFDIPFEPSSLQRHFYTTSSCGVCGKSSIEAIYQSCPSQTPVAATMLDAGLICSLPERLREHQELFNATGGLHAAALFDLTGQFTILREDIGRHNALDKVIGDQVAHNALPLSSSILLLSGRACFELLQKAAMAGIRIVVAIGPPSSLAVEFAAAHDITLIGFLRDLRFNIYTGAHRIRT